jgi:hypothetical protein
MFCNLKPVEEPPPNVANEFNSNEIVCDPGLRKRINEYVPDIQDQVRMFPSKFCPSSLTFLESPLIDTDTRHDTDTDNNLEK